MVRVDRAVMFGLASSAGVFRCVADMLVDIYVASGFGPLVKWVDDFFVICLPEHSWTEHDFLELTASIGVPWSIEKLRPLSTIQQYIGFNWHLDSKEVSIPSDKLGRIHTLLSTWLQPGVKMTAHDASSLHGKLIHISSIYPLLRPFLRSLALFAGKFQSVRARLHPTAPVVADIQWIIELLAILPNQLPLLPSSPTDLDWWGDASTSFGIGVTIGGLWAVWKWADNVKVGPKQRYDIGWAEAVAIELALRLALNEGLLPPGHFLVRSDNAGVVAVLNRGRSRSRETNEVLKNVYHLMARHKLRLTAIHVSTRINVADALSRGDIEDFLSGFPKARSRVECPLPPHLSDLLIPF